MNTPRTLTAVAFVLSVTLVACGLFQPQSPQTTPSATTFPPTITSNQVLAVSPTAASVGVAPNSSVQLTFAAGVDRVAAQAQFVLLPGVYTTNIGTQKLTLTAMCNGRWRVRNPAAATVVFTWDVYNTAEKASGIVPGGSDVFFTTSSGQKTVRVFVGGALHNTKAANTNACSGTPADVPGKLAGTSAWNGDAFTFTPNLPLSSQQAYTVFVGLAQPYAGAFEAGGTPLKITGANPASFANDRDTTVKVTGEGFNLNTSFFIQSNRLELLGTTPSEATVRVPAGFLASVYGLMAANADGARATLYPALTISQGATPRDVDPQRIARAFVDGYVTNYATGAALAGTRVSLNSATGTLEATTDADGYYLIRGVPTGKQSFRIEKTGFEPVYRIANLSSATESYTMKLAALEPKSERTTVIGAAGGIHYATDAGASGPYLQIPAGALERDVPIQFTQLRSANTLPELPQDGSFLAFAHLGPTGLTFKKPATLFLPLQPNISVAVGTRINIFYFDAKRAEWVDDITSGKISNVGGKLYLEYEINHFTWIGGTWFPDPVSGCVRYRDGTPASRVLTNYGISDAAGIVSGTTTRSDVGRILTLEAIGRPGSTTSTAPYDGRAAVNFSCITVPKRTITPTAWTPEPVTNLVPYVPDPGTPPAPPPPPPCPGGIRGFAEQARIAVNSAALTRQAGPGATGLLTANSLYGFTMNIPDWKEINVDPSSIKFEIGGKDYTDKADFVYPSPTVSGALQIKLTLGEPMRAQSALTATVSGTTREGQRGEAATQMDVAASITALPIQFVRVDRFASVVEDLETDDVVTPVTVVNEGAVVVLYKEGDNLAGYEVKVPVVALDEVHQLVDIDRPSVTFDTVDWVGASASPAPMVDGKAFVSVRLNVQDPGLLKLDTANLRLGIESGATAQGLKAQFAFLLVPIAIEVVKDVTIVVGGLFVAAATAVYLDEQRRQGVLPFPVLPQPTSFPVCRRPLTTQPIVASSSGNAPLDVPFIVVPSVRTATFNDCKNQLPDWRPPQKGSTRYNEIKTRVEARRVNDGKSSFDTSSTPSSGRGKLQSSIEDGLFPRNYPNSNRFLESTSQLATNKSGGAEKILTELRYDQLLKEAGSKAANPSVSLYGHLIRILQVGRSIANYMKNYGIWDGKDKTPKICLSQDELDVLSVIQDMIIEILEQYNGWRP